MCYLANVLSDSKAFFKGNVLYNVVKTKEELIPNIPTLIVGWDKVKELYPDASILDWKINDLTYWTYGRRVKRDKFEEDVDKFKKLVFDKVSKEVKYDFFSVLTSTKEEKKVVFDFIKSDGEKYVLLKQNMLYIYSKVSDRTIGINLADIEYEGGNKSKLLSNIFNNPNITVVKEQDYISSDTRELINNKKYIIPYLSSKTA